MINILVVDDSGVIRLQTRQMLKELNCRIFEAVNGMQVLQNTFSKDYFLKDMDLVLLDLYLGEIDGYDILKVITNSYPNLPVIIMSIERKRESILKCIELGAKDYILKPFDKELLLSRIKRFHNILSREQIEVDIKELDNTLLFELDRALRANTPLSVLIVKIMPNKNIEQNVLYSLKENLKNILRKIDNVIIYKRFVVLTLPLTNRNGLEVVKSKIASAFSDLNITHEDMREKSFVYPDDVQENELIQNYNSSGIKDLILQMIIDMLKK